MKRLVLITFAASFCLMACNGSDLQKKARENPKGGAGPAAPQQKPNPEDQSIGVVNAPAKADIRKMGSNNKALRYIRLGEEGMFQTSVFCSMDPLKNIKEKERVKLSGQSQVIFRQVELPPPASEPDIGRGASRDTTARSLISFSCAARNEIKSALPKNVTVENLEVGNHTQITGLFSDQSAAELKAVVGCTTSEQMGEADKVLLQEEAEKRVDILMAAPAKMLIETSKEKDSSEKKYLLLSCDAAPATK